MEARRKHIRKTLSKMRYKTFVLWVFTAIVPLFVLVVYIWSLGGPGVAKLILNPQKINDEIWQLNGWNATERIDRYLNEIILTDPEKLLDQESLSAYQDSKKMKRFGYIIIMRKGDTYTTLNDFDSNMGQVFLESIKSRESEFMPAFGSVEFDGNATLLQETGYSIMHQLDFYFSDGEEGSVFYLLNVINVSSVIGSFLFHYFMIIFFLYFIGVGLISAKSTFSMTKRLANIIYATEEISQEHFDVYIDKRGDNPFSILGTYIESMAKTLKRAKLYREDVDKSRNAFLDATMHDLKTPLTAIKMQVEAIKDGVVTDPEQVKYYLNSIERKVDNIDKMLNEMKVFTKLINEPETYEMSLVPFDAFIQDIVTEWQYDVADEALIIDYNMSADAKGNVLIDSFKLKRVLINIFENALKYVENRPLELKITLRRVSHKFVLSIIDNGQGVAADKLMLIFEQYYRVDDARGQVVSGSGLGLAISREIIERHGGLISAHNDESCGLEIRIELEVADE